MTMSQSHPHILLVCQAVQGHLNPCFQLANNLIRTGARVTLATPVSGFHNLKSLPSMHGLSFASFTDGHDENINAFWNPGYYYDIERFGSESIASLVKTMSQSGNKVNLLVYTLYLPFVAHVARRLNVHSAFFLIQSATCFSIYKHFCKVKNDFNASFTLKLSGLPLFKLNDLPTFVLPKFPRYLDMCYVYQDHMHVLKKDPNACVLVNTLDGLEPDSVKLIKNSIVVGPLVSSTFSCNKGSCLKWLDSKKENSVVYVSFGSLAVLTKAQKVELLHGLMKTQRPFLLVLRDVGENEDLEIKELKEKVSEFNGLIVGWCAQLEVLKHRAIGCFVTHCGWNSTLESLVAGVAIVGCPQFSDQTTNAKMVEEVWGNGVRAVLDEEIMVVKRDEIKRCLDVVMGGGERAKEIRKNTEKWRKVAEKSVRDGGSLQTNLKLFLQNIS